VSHLALLGYKHIGTIAGTSNSTVSLDRKRRLLSAFEHGLLREITDGRGFYRSGGTGQCSTTGSKPMRSLLPQI
jgi:hypothetical protein